MRRLFSKLAGLGLAAVMCSAAAAPARADCDHDKVTVSGTGSERALACNALVDVLGYFSSIGFPVEPELGIIFSDDVYIDLYGPAPASPPIRSRVSGYYDSKRKRIEITRGSSRFREDCHPWKQSWSPEIADSILRHEIAHMAIKESLGKRYARMAKPWLEYIAYSVQFDLMDKALRDRITASYPGIHQVQQPAEINTFLYNADPDAFAVIAYRFTEANGGRAFIRRLLKGEVDFDTDELMWTK